MKKTYVSLLLMMAFLIAPTTVSATYSSEQTVLRLSFDYPKVANIHFQDEEINIPKEGFVDVPFQFFSNDKIIVFFDRVGYLYHVSDATEKIEYDAQIIDPSGVSVILERNSFTEVVKKTTLGPSLFWLRISLKDSYRKKSKGVYKGKLRLTIQELEGDL